MRLQVYAIVIIGVLQKGRFMVSKLGYTLSEVINGRPLASHQRYCRRQVNFITHPTYSGGNDRDYLRGQSKKGSRKPPQS